MKGLGQDMAYFWHSKHSEWKGFWFGESSTVFMLFESRMFFFSVF